MTDLSSTIRHQFPNLARMVNGRPLVYLDNGATTHKPLSVIEAQSKFYSEQNSNIHRGVHTLSQEATSAFEAVREKTRAFINAKEAHEVIFTSGTTDGINLVASSFGELLAAGDEVILSGMEHHSNIVPWHMLRDSKGVVLRFIPITDAGELDMAAFHNLLSPRTKLVSVTWVSNALGTVNPVVEIVAAAHAKGVKVLIDAAQAVHHIPINVQEIDCDLLVFSGHKMYGPTGTGVLYGKEALLNQMPPYRGGGDMIKTVSLEATTYNDLPHKFEAGTPNIAGVIGLGAAIDFISELGWQHIVQHEREVISYAIEALSAIDGLRLVGTPINRSGVISFLMDGAHPYDVGVILDKLGIAVRTGHHCAQPLMDRFNIPGTVRASFAVYNTKQEVDLLVDGIEKAKRMLS